MLAFRLLRLTLLPPWPTGPRNLKRILLLLILTPLFLLLQSIHWVGFLLDDLFFRGYREIEIREPLHIVGLPRSGTTFLQRVFAQDTGRFTTLRLWELLLAPSVTERKVWLGMGRLNRALGNPLARLGRRAEETGLGWLDAIHQVSLSDPEEDYFLLLPVFACFLLVVPFPYHERIWDLSRFDELPETERRSIMAFYRSALQRHLYVVGSEKRLLSKNPSFTPFIRSIRESFPDGRVLCCVRDPLRVVPSQLSSIQVGANLFGYDVAEPRIRDRFVAMLAHYGNHALATLGETPDDRHAFVPLAELKKDVEGFVLQLYDRFGWDPDPEFRERLAQEAKRGREYRSHHSYSLEEFGLSYGDIQRRFSKFNEYFGFGASTSDLSPGEKGLG